MKLFDEVRAPLTLTPWKPPPGGCCTPGMTLSSELKSRPLSGISSARLLSMRLFNSSENSISGLTPWTVIVSALDADLELEVGFASALANTCASRVTVLNPEMSP